MKPGRFIFPAFLLITLITYFPTIGSGFVFDFVGWQRLYDQGSFTDIINCFGYKGNQQVYHLFFYTIYYFFHLKGLPWYFVFCALHAFNGWLLFVWMRQVTHDWGISIPFVFILLTILVFLIHPYCVEPVAYKACVQYLISLSAILGLLILVPRYIIKGEVRYLWMSVGIYFLSLFAIEISYVTPIVLSLYLWMYSRIPPANYFSKPRAIQVVISVWLLLFLCLLINKFTLGAWVGHYGTAVHFNFDPMGMISTETKYLVKHLTDARMFSFSIKNFLFDQLLSNTMATSLFLFTGLLVISLYLFRSKSWKRKWHLVFFALAASLIYTLPVSNLFFYHLDVGANDRFSYVPLVFAWVFVAALIADVAKKAVIPAFSMLLVLQLFWQQKIIHYWHESTIVLHSLKTDYRWRDASHVFVLNSPDNYKGVWMTTMIRINSGIDELIDHQTNRENKGIMYDIYQFNMNSPNDGVKVEQTGPMQLKVTFNQWGNWWHLYGIGATPYENEYYKAEVLDYPYQVTFKQFPPGSVIIYQDSMKWKEFVLKEIE